MTKSFFNIFVRGIRFVSENPQIIYTFFLMIVIPLAFFFTSEQFLKVAQENQDKLERNRIAVLQNVFTLFTREHFYDSEYLNTRINTIAKDNETIVNFQVLGIGSDNKFPIIASLDSEEIGTMVTPDTASSFLYGSVLGNPDEVFAMQFFADGERYWRGMSAVKATSTEQIIGYVVADLSMAQADQIARKSITNAYAVLLVIIILIFILLVRQTRILDYATLYKRLQEVDKVKDDFMSMAAHELRTPLGVIRGYAQLLNDIKNLSEKDRESIQRIEVSARDLTLLINDILDVGHIEQGKLSLDYSHTDIHQLIQSLVDSFAPLAKEKNLALRMEVHGEIPLIIADGTRLKQIFTNIIGNAIKYTSEGSVIVNLSIEDKNIVVRVSDTGFGISADEQQQLFQKFSRIKTKETHDIRGTGLGLWITRQILNVMKGKISVESIKGKGSDFIITFPAVKK